MNIGLIGLGHLGKIHLKCLQQINEWNITGYYDLDPDLDVEGIRKYKSIAELMEQCDAVDIITSTSAHFDIMAEAIKMDKHIFVEKPMCSTYAQAVQIKQMAQGKSSIIQVGHVERYNPAIMSLTDVRLKPLFIEVDRLAPFNLRGTDVSVVMDLMIHDLDIILDLVKSPVSKVDANAISILSEAPDICNARIQFENGCVANVTASRISLKHMRKIRVFQKDAYVSLDFLEKKSQIIRLIDPAIDGDSDGIELDTAQGKRIVQIKEPEIVQNNAIVHELTDFYNSIKTGQKPLVSIEEAAAAIDLAEKISQSADLNVKQLENI